MIIQYLIILPMVFLAGFVDAIAGGGGLISLPAYMLAGLPAHNAIATNKLSSAMGTTVATIKYARSGYISWKYVAVGIAFAFAGSALGARLVLMVSDHYFKILMLAALPFIAFYVLRGRAFDEEREPYSVSKTAVICAISAFVVGVYDGFYGPGTGTFLILLFTGAAHMAVTDANGACKAINLTTNVAALTVFLMSGKTIIVMGLIAGVFNIMGNYLGARCFVKNGAKFVRPVVIVVLVIFVIKLVTDLLSG